MTESSFIFLTCTRLALPRRRPRQRGLNWRKAKSQTGIARVKRPFFIREIGPRLFESNIQVPINDLMLNVPTGLAIFFHQFVNHVPRKVLVGRLHECPRQIIVR